MSTPLDRQISVVPAWAAIGVGWLVGHALAAVLLGDKSEGDLWFLPWVAVFVLGAPAIARAKIIPGRYAVAFGVIWCVAVGFSLYTPPCKNIASSACSSNWQ